MSTKMNEESKSVTLRSSDGMLFVVDEKTVALESKTINDIMIAGAGDGVINIDNVRGSSLGLFVDYLNDVVSKPKRTLDESFYAQLDDLSLFEFMKAAYHLKVRSLYKCNFREFTRRVSKQSLEELQKWLKLTRRFTPQDKERLVETFKFFDLP